MELNSNSLNEQLITSQSQVLLIVFPSSQNWVFFILTSSFFCHSSYHPTSYIGRRINMNNVLCTENLSFALNAYNLVHFAERMRTEVRYSGNFFFYANIHIFHQIKRLIKCIFYHQMSCTNYSSVFCLHKDVAVIYGIIPSSALIKMKNCN